MKKLFVFIMIAFIAISANAQETFFPTTEGTVMVYKSFDKKWKQSSGAKYTIKNVKKDGDNLDITYLIESLNPKDELVYNDEITVQLRGDVLYMDMSNLVNKAAFQQDGQMPADIKVTGNNMELPTNISPGQTLPDANIEMTMKMGFVNMKMGAQVTDRKLETIENITVPAGTFKAYKFTSNVTATAYRYQYENPEHRVVCKRDWNGKIGGLRQERKSEFEYPVGRIEQITRSD